MLISMTGFASKSVQLPNKADETPSTITINIKSLNSRFFETTFKMPNYVSILETEIVQVLKTKLKRGHIFFNLNISNNHLTKGTIEPSLDIVRGYIEATHKIQEKFHLGGALSLNDVLHLPNVFAIEEKNLDDQLKELIISTTQQVLEELINVRKNEGQALEKDLIQRSAVIEQEIRSVEQISEKIMQERKEAISKELHALNNQAEPTEAQRLALYNELNKIDIHEEIVRFKTHLAAIQKILKGTEQENGKRIDFTLQELSREINTIAAKSSDANIGSLAINIKVELEKIREQAQNIV